MKDRNRTLPVDIRLAIAPNGGWVIYGKPPPFDGPGYSWEMLAAFTDWTQLLDFLRKCSIPDPCGSASAYKGKDE